MLNNLFAQGHYIYRTLIVAIMFLICYMFIEENGKNTIIKLRILCKQRWKIAFFLYASFVFTSTVLGRATTNPYQTVFDHIWFGEESKYNYMIVENIMLFIPYTFLFLHAFKIYKALFTSFILSLLTTVFIEVSQLLFWLGAFQISDIIYNVIGGMLGFICWCIYNHLTGLIKRNINKKKTNM